MTSELVWIYWMIASIIVLVGWEAYCIVAGKKVLTFAARDAMRNYPGLICILIFNLGVLFGHLFVS